MNGDDGDGEIKRIAATHVRHLSMSYDDDDDDDDAKGIRVADLCYLYR